jgi:hypothetical protein
MGKKCPQCGYINEEDDEVIVGVFMDDYDAPGNPNIVHTFCDMTCFKRWDDSSNYIEITDSRKSDKVKNINYDKLYY